MKNKVITFCAAMGIPISSWGSISGCTGICGSCQLSCLPGAAAVVILLVKIFSKKIVGKRRARYDVSLLFVFNLYIPANRRFIPNFIYQNNNKTDNEQKVEINSSAYKHGRYKICTGKYMGKHSLIHQLCNSLRSRKRKHIYRYIDCGLKKDNFHHSGSVQPESKVYHICQKKYATSL